MRYYHKSNKFKLIKKKSSKIKINNYKKTNLRNKLIKIFWLNESKLALKDNKLREYLKKWGGKKVDYSTRFKFKKMILSKLLCIIKIKLFN